LRRSWIKAAALRAAARRAGYGEHAFASTTAGTRTPEPAAAQRPGTTIAALRRIPARRI
jgi:hypothetical protein